MTNDPETEQIRAFLKAGHPLLAFGIPIVRRVFTEDRSTRLRRFIGWGSLSAGVLAIAPHFLRAFLH